MFLEECKYVVKEIKIRNYITNDVQISSDKNDLLEIFSDYKEHILMRNLWKNILIKKVQYNIFSGFLVWSSFIFRAYAGNKIWENFLKILEL